VIVLGLDPSQSTGFAMYQPPSRHSPNDEAAALAGMELGTLRAKGGDYEEKAGSLGAALVNLLRDPTTRKCRRIDLAVIERPLRTQPGAGGKKKVKFLGEETGEEAAAGSGLNAVISSNQMVGAICAILSAYRIPFITMDAREWRKLAYGFGTRPGWQRADWKRHARAMCAQHRIVVTNDDMAEAAWIAFAGAGTQTAKMMLERVRAAA
jgi:hypothetical protein